MRFGTSQLSRQGHTAMQAITEPATVDELHARYKLARRNIDRAAIICSQGSPSAVRPSPRKRPPEPKLPERPIIAIGSPVNPTMTFSTCLQGSSNRLAHAAAFRASEAAEYNPLVLHGRSGYGKSHLLQAIANERPGKALYLTADWFIANQTLARDHALHGGFDIVLIDDIQHIRSQSARAFFLNVMTPLINTGRQLVVASDRPPCDLDDLEQSIRSRLSGGLVVEVHSHDRALRYDILKARFSEVKLPSFRVPESCVNYMADEIKSGGRDLDGVFHRLLAKSSMEGAAIDMELVVATVAELVKPMEPRRVLIDEIQRTVARHYNISRADMISARRTANVVRPRQFAMYLAKKLTPKSLPEIGRRFGHRDHTTVIHAVRKMEALVARDSALAAEEMHFRSLLAEPAQ